MGHPLRFAGTRGRIATRFFDHRIDVASMGDKGKGEDAELVSFVFTGASKRVSMEAEEPQQGLHNFLLGNDSTRWVTGVHGFSRVAYRDLYPGVDVEVHDGGGLFQYDLYVAPGACLDDVRIRVCGAKQVEIDEDGALVVTTRSPHPLRQTPPKAWYEREDGEHEVIDGVRFVKLDESTFGFEVPDLDPSLELVIDPMIVWGTYFGGTMEDHANDVKVFQRAIGSANTPVDDYYVVGRTRSDVTDAFPVTTATAFASSANLGTQTLLADAWVARFDSVGGRVWTTYLGGSDNDQAFGVVVNSAGVPTVVGQTYSSDFPRMNAAQSAFGGCADAFVARLNSAGSALVYATLLGGDVFDAADDVALFPDGSVAVTGRTGSSNFPVTSATAFQAMNASPAMACTSAAMNSTDAFVTTVSPTGAAFPYSSFIGAEDDDYGQGVVVDSGGNIIVVGLTDSFNFPVTSNAFDAINSGFSNGLQRTDAFVSRLRSPNYSTLQYSTYLGGRFLDEATDVVLGPCTEAVNSASPLYQEEPFVTVVGFTEQPDDLTNNFPVAATSSLALPSAAPFQSAYGGGGADAFLSRVDFRGFGATSLPYSTYIGGAGGDRAYAIAADNANIVSVVGDTNSTFPVTPNAFQGAIASGQDAFVVHATLQGFGPALGTSQAAYNLSDLNFSTYQGGTSYDFARGVSLSPTSDMAVVGGTSSTDFPAVAFGTPFQSMAAGSTDAFVATYDLCVADAVEPPLVAWWPLDERQSPAIDLVAADNGTWNGGPSWTLDGLVDVALCFDGTDDYVDVADSGDRLDFGRCDFSIMLWARVDPTNHNQPLICKRNPTEGNDCGYGLGVTASGRLNLILSGSMNRANFQTPAVASGGPYLQDGCWHHFVATVDREAGPFKSQQNLVKEVKLYVDGVLWATYTNQGRFGCIDSDAHLVMGMEATAGGTDFLLGCMDEVQLAGEVVTLEDVRKNYKAGSFGRCKNPITSAATCADCSCGDTSDE